MFGFIFPFQIGIQNIFRVGRQGMRPRPDKPDISDISNEEGPRKTIGRCDFIKRLRGNAEARARKVNKLGINTFPASAEIQTVSRVRSVSLPCPGHTRLPCVPVSPPPKGGHGRDTSVTHSTSARTRFCFSSLPCA